MMIPAGRTLSDDLSAACRKTGSAFPHKSKILISAAEE
jgi:hypothetical protein